MKQVHYHSFKKNNSFWHHHWSSPSLLDTVGILEMFLKQHQLLQFKIYIYWTFSILFLNDSPFGIQWPSRLGLTLRIGRILVQTQPVEPNLVMRLPVAFRFNQELNAVINIGLVRLISWQWPEVGYGAAK